MHKILALLVVILSISSFTKAECDNKDESSVVTKAVKSAAFGIGTSAAVTGSLAAAGLAKVGIVGGSVVAGLQSLGATGATLPAIIGFTKAGIASGSIAAVLQSTAMTGGLAVLGPVGIGVAAVAGGGAFIYNILW